LLLLLLLLLLSSSSASSPVTGLFFLVFLHCAGFSFKTAVLGVAY
jgi:hypothetical protein